MRALKVYVSGIVQGVGFRPFTHRIARKSGVRGTVRNLGGSEVEIHVEGDDGQVEKFMELLRDERPPPALIEDLKVVRAKVTGYRGFEILKSGESMVRASMIPPDMGICDECLREVLDPENRRHMYPFNSCAWCGPRFSSIERVPYDRENTSMRDFPLCDACSQEYYDPDNVRRFDAQGISCPSDGPRIWLTERGGNNVSCESPVEEAAKLLDEGKIVAIKGVGGFHIASSATDDKAVMELRKRKGRPQKPFALMALDIQTARKIVHLSEESHQVLSGHQRPILLLEERQDSPLSNFVAPGLDRQGIMLPYTALHHLLLNKARDRVLVMTSGNAQGKPMCLDEDCALRELREIVDYFLLHNRKIFNRVDDSVCRFTDGQLTFIRRSRGYAPVWIELPMKLKRPIVAFGAELQNAGAVAFRNRAVMTQFIGDTDEFEDLEEMEKSLRFFIRVYGLDPRRAILVADRHPAYSSGRLAREWAKNHGSELLLVQHHHAHIASAMADWGVDPGTRVSSIAMDAVGYGDDGKIWGGEAMVTSYIDFERLGHLAYQPMPGGDLATRYPVRMLVGILSGFMGDGELLGLARKLRLIRGLKHGEQELSVAIAQTRSSGAIRSSSLGRVLDSASALLGICFERTYEGEPAIKLEAAARGGRGLDQIEAPIKGDAGSRIVDTSSLFETIISNLELPRQDLAFSVHVALGNALGRLAAEAVRRADTEIVFANGGAAVNSYIIRAVRKVLKEEGISLKLPRRVPAGDGGIALGQIAVAAAKASEA